MNFNKPLLFKSNRVWRAYVGGKLMDELINKENKPDGHFPEDWLASTTIANNYANQQSPEEGLTRVKNEDGSDGELFKDLISSHSHDMLGNNTGDLGVLCKYLDSAIRLPIQCHPDKAFSLKHLDSPNGKTESWFVLGTRTVNGEEPYLLMGFKEGVDEEEFKQAVRDENISFMEAALHKIPVKEGDMYFIPGKLPHAIGPGVFLLEVQEPTDWVVQPERFLGDTELSREVMWGPLSVEDGLTCFDYDSKSSLDELNKRCALKKKELTSNASYVFNEIIGPTITDCFSVYDLSIHSSCSLSSSTWAIAIVTKGNLSINEVKLEKGDYFFIPHSLQTLTIEGSDASLYLISSAVLDVR